MYDMNFKNFLKSGNFRATRRILRSTSAGSPLIGSLLGGVLGVAVSAVVNEAVETYVRTEADEQAENSEKARINSEYRRRIERLPAQCLYCGAPTCGKMYCEYCESKMI